MVRECPCLWDQTSHEYSETRNKSAKWNEISNALGIKGTIAKETWETLRDGYRRELKKIPRTRSGGAAPLDVFQPKWQFFVCKDFLRACIEPRKTTGNLEVVEIDDIDNITDGTQNVSTVGTQNLSSNAIDEMIEDDEEAASSCSRSTTSSKRKSAYTPAQQLYRTIEEKKLKLMEQRMAERSRAPTSPDLEFLGSLLPHIEKMTDLQKLRFQQKVLDLVGELLYDEVALSY